MSIKLGTTTIAGINQFQTNAGWNIFDCKWSDHILNDIQWLRADTFSWQSGSVYTTAYNHLVSDISGITAETETVGSYTVTFYRATDGHKICLADQETTVANIFSATGIAWYYILDTDNTQFKLPRTKYGFEGLRDTVGDKIDESLPNIKGTATTIIYDSSYPNNPALSGSFSKEYATATISSLSSSSSGAGFHDTGITLDASNSSSTYQDNAPVQERATQMYLYFYVGEYTQTAIEQTAGITTEQLNNKVDLNLQNFNTSNLSSSQNAYFSRLGMPSRRYTDITLGASGTTFTAPANGYFYFYGTSTATNQWVSMFTQALASTANAPSSASFGVPCYVPVYEGETMTIFYNIPVTQFRFYYAEGDE